MKHYTNILEAMNNLLTAMNEEHIRLVAESNAQADEARALAARVQNTIEQHEELSSIMDEITKTMVVKRDGMTTATANIKEALSALNDAEVPLCAVEEFEGYCSKCGEELLTGSQWGYGVDGEPLCIICLDEEAKETEPSESVETPTEVEVAAE